MPLLTEGESIRTLSHLQAIYSLLLDPVFETRSDSTITPMHPQDTALRHQRALKENS